MNFIKRAWLSMIRRKGKSLLLFAVIFILGNVIAGAIAIQQATQTVEKKIKSEMGSTVKVVVDYEKVIASGSETDIDSAIPEFPVSLIEQIGQSELVKYYDYSVTTAVGSGTLKPFVPQFLQDEAGNFGSDPNADKTSFILRGTSYAKVAAIEEQRMRLVDGRVFTDEEIKNGTSVGLITEQLAKQNNVHVGDTITLTAYVIEWETGAIHASQDYTVQVIGVVAGNEINARKQSQGSDGDRWIQAFMEQTAANTLLVPNAVPVAMMRYIVEGELAHNTNLSEIQKSMMQKGLQHTFYEPSYVLKNPESLEPFREEVAPLLPENYKLEAASDDYARIAAPVQSMSELSGYVLWIAAIATVTIVTLVVLLFLRDRKHELGIYLSFGEKRGRVIAQIMVEVLVIAVVSMTVSVFTGNALAQGVSGALIQNQIAQDAQDNTEPGHITQPTPSIGGFDNLGPNLDTSDVLEAYQVQLTPEYLMIFYIVGLGVVALSAVVPMVYIVRLNPKKIMM